MRELGCGLNKIVSPRGDRHNGAGSRSGPRIGTAVAALAFAATGCGIPSLSSGAEDTATLGAATTVAPTAGSATGTDSTAVDGGQSTPLSTTVESSPSEAPVYQTELILSDSGLGGRPFGAEPEDVITYVQSLLGSPTEDSGWVEAAEYPACPGTQVRIVEWGVLSLQFSDASPIQPQGQHFFAWTYGETSEIGQSPEGLLTAEGIGPGSSLAQVKAAYSGTAVSEGDADTAFPDSFFVPDRYWGLLTGPADDDLVTQISSSLGCGE